MVKVLIQGLGDEGPADIVGAITGETDVTGDSIGRIEINEGHAIVEIDAGAVEKVITGLDGGKVGEADVSLKRLDEGEGEAMEAVDSYVKTYKQLVELEREEEMRQHEEEIRDLAGHEREDRGRASLDMRGRDEGEGLGGHLVKFMKERNDEPLPELEIAVGDLVMVSKNDPLREDNPTGTVVQKTNYSLTVAFDPKPQDFVYGRGLRLDLYVNDITYQRMKDALDKIGGATGRLAELQDVIVGVEEPAEVEAVEIDEWNNDNLNDSQRAAVRKAVGADDFYLIHGPPGTGKTTTAIEVVEQYVERGRSVLATAASNMAVDNMLEFLIDQGVDAVRVGHPARVTPALRERTLDNLVEEKSKYRKSRELREKAFDVKEEQDDLTHPSGRYRRGMSNEQIKQLAEQGRGSRGVSPEKIEEMAEWIELQEEADELFERSDELEDEAVQEVLDEADVVCTTNSTAGSELIEDAEFDALVIDEATQATEPSCLIPLTHADEVVMAGDHRQLPPTVKNEDAARRGLDTTLFERLVEEHGSAVKDMLTVQYRMHEKIMRFSSQEFYDGRLQADESVRGHTLADLAFDLDAVSEENREILEPSGPVVFVDTSNIDAPERTRPGSTSKENRQEAELVAGLGEDCLAAGLDAEDLAVISPYDDQVDLIRSKLDWEELEVKTVDGFQGREKEVVLISLTRSNSMQNIGFLQDIRRLNVALTRAKRKLVVVGDGGTITSNETYENFVRYVEEQGKTVELS